MKNIFLQAIKFFGISGFGWLLDFTTYTVLGFFSHNLFLNNMISSWVGVTFAFVFSVKTVFKNQGKLPLKIKYPIYILYQVFLIFIASGLVNVINVQILNFYEIEIIRKTSFIIAKIFITPITMGLNFFVMKCLIEKL